MSVAVVGCRPALPLSSTLYHVYGVLSVAGVAVGLVCVILVIVCVMTVAGGYAVLLV